MTGQMKRDVRPIPEGYHTVTSVLTVPGANRLIDFLQKAFDAKVLFRMDGPNGTVGHAELKIGDSIVMLGDPNPQFAPKPVNIYLYVPDVDAVYRRAIEAGAKPLTEVKDQFYGDRNGGVEDPCGNSWWIATHVEDVSPDELNRRMAALKKA